MPAFLFRKWNAGAIPRLPEPAEPFGLALQGIRLTSERLRAVSRFKNLQSLDLWLADVGDSELTELAGFENIRCSTLN